MKNYVSRRSLAVFLVIVLGYALLHSIYYGSLLRSCIYTEQDVALNTALANSEITVFRSATVLKGTEAEYACLPQMSLIKNEFQTTEDAKYDTKREKHSISSDTNLVLTPIKLISVTKHGLETIDSGPGPILYLIMKDSAGQMYKSATVALGLNRGDEFLRATTGDQQTILSADTHFTN